VTTLRARAANQENLVRAVPGGEGEGDPALTKKAADSSGGGAVATTGARAAHGTSMIPFAALHLGLGAVVRRRTGAKE
jgi:hypothetical protein